MLKNVIIPGLREGIYWHFGVDVIYEVEVEP